MSLLFLLAPSESVATTIAAGTVTITLVPQSASVTLSRITAGTAVIRLNPDGALVTLAPAAVVVTPPTAAEVLAAQLATSHQPRARVVTLHPDRSTRAVYDPLSIALDGSVTFDRTRAVRRSLSLTVVDVSGGLAPTAYGHEFAQGELIAIERGVRVDGMNLYDLLGTFEVLTFSSAMEGTLTISGEDPSIALSAELGEVVTIPAGMSIEDALRVLWGPVLGDSTLWTLDGNGMTVGSVRTFAEDDERLGVALALVADMGLEAYLDRRGYPVLRPVSDPNAAPVAWTFYQTPGQARAMRLERTGDRHPYNRQVVIGEPVDAPAIRAVADVTDPASPIHADRIGLRVAPVYRSAQITTQGQANAVAAAKLIEASLWSDTVIWTGVPDTRIEAGDVIELVEPRTQTNGRYRVDRVSVPITMGTMTIAASKVLPLFAQAA